MSPAATSDAVNSKHPTAVTSLCGGTSAPLSCVGRSVEERPIEAFFRPGPSDHMTMVFGAFHGDEPKTVHVARRLIEWLASDATVGCDGGWVVVPVVNPDGFVRRKRRNANGIDLNRNFPTQNWTVGRRRSRMFGGTEAASEPETRAVIHLIDKVHPTRVITIHSIGAHRFCNNYDGPAQAWAESMSRLNGYPAAGSIGYPTPGSFGTWIGVERQIPTITLELPSHHSSKRCWADNREALLVSS